MTGKITLLMAIILLSPSGLSPHAIDDLVTRLDSMDCYHATVRYVVTLTQANDDAVCDLVLESQLRDGVRAYLIDRHTTDGFSACIGSRHYRFRDHRLHEYDDTADDTSAPFEHLLPHGIASKMRCLAVDPTYRLTVDTDSRRHTTTVNADMTIDGHVCTSSRYTFDTATGRPLTIEIESNPGSAGEQITTADYSYDTTDAPCPTLTEARLAERYPDAFGRFRKSELRIDNLLGSRLPGFALPTPTGERYTYRSGDGFAITTIVALLNAIDASTPDVVADLRSAVDRMPIEANLIFAFTDNRHDDIDNVCPTLRVGETTLMNARKLADNCGVDILPTIIICRRNGTVSDAIVGYNNDLSTSIIQATTLAAR